MILDLDTMMMPYFLCKFGFVLVWYNSKFSRELSVGQASNTKFNRNTFHGYRVKAC
jgi:hypothetical protein